MAILCILLVIAALAITSRQLAPGRQQSALAPPVVHALAPAMNQGLSDEPDYPRSVRFSQYSTSMLARGGVGTVFRSVHPDSGTVYAIKQLSKQFVRDQVVIDAFHRGVAMLMQLRHPNIVRVYYDWVEPGDGCQEHYAIMEFLSGETLHDLVRREAPLSVDDRFMSLVTSIGEAVSYLHSHEIIHRDIKPENFRFSNGRFKLLDFDTAVHRLHRGMLHQDGLPIGTPEYMSPEQARGAVDIDPRTDVYSFGMLIYELLTGTVPFTGAPSRVLIDQMESVPTPPKSINPQLPPSISSIILMALNKERDRRFQSISAVLTALRSAYSAERPTVFPTANGGNEEATTE